MTDCFCCSSFLAPRSQLTFLFTSLKIILSLFLIAQLIIIASLFMISIFQLRFDRLLDILLTFGLFSITFVGLLLEDLSMLIISTIYFLFYFLNSFFIPSFIFITYLILFINAFGMLLFSYLTFKGITKNVRPADS